MTEHRQGYFNFLTHAIGYVNSVEKMAGSITIPEYDARVKASLCLEDFAHLSNDTILDTIKEIRQIYLTN